MAAEGTAPAAMDMNAAVAAALANFPGGAAAAPAAAPVVVDPLLAAAAASAGVPVPQPAASPAFDMLAAAGGVPAVAAAAAAPAPAKSTGKVKQFDEDKGFGFIVPDDGSDDIFVHRNVAGSDRTAYLTKGETIEYEKEWDSNKNKWRAKSCTGFRSRQEEGGEPPKKQQCNDFKRGQCTRGDRCKYAHGDDNDSNGGGWNAGGGGWNSGNDWKSGGDWNNNNNGNNDWNNGGNQGGNQWGAAGGQDQLPPGWEAATDPNTGGTYYANRTTGESSWTKPVGPAPVAAPAAAPLLPLGWEAATDPSSGKTYYANRSTGETSWTPPAAQPQIMAAPVMPPMPVAVPGALPAGWEMTTDQASGKTYYFNRGTGATSWTPPVA